MIRFRHADAMIEPKPNRPARKLADFIGLEIELEKMWASLRERGRRNRPSVHLPEWARIPR